MLIYITTHCQISQHIFANKLENQVRTIYTHPSSGNEICNALVFKIHWKITHPTSHLNAGLVVGGNVLHPHTATSAMSKANLWG